MYNLLVELLGDRLFQFLSLFKQFDLFLNEDLGDVVESDLSYCSSAMKDTAFHVKFVRGIAFSFSVFTMF